MELQEILRERAKLLGQIQKKIFVLGVIDESYFRTIHLRANEGGFSYLLMDINGIIIGVEGKKTNGTEVNLNKKATLRMLERINEGILAVLN